MSSSDEKEKKCSGQFWRYCLLPVFILALGGCTQAPLSERGEGKIDKRLLGLWEGYFTEEASDSKKAGAEVKGYVYVTAVNEHEYATYQFTGKKYDKNDHEMAKMEMWTTGIGGELFATMVYSDKETREKMSKWGPYYVGELRFSGGGKMEFHILSRGFKPTFQAKTTEELREKVTENLKNEKMYEKTLVALTRVSAEKSKEVMKDFNSGEVANNSALAEKK